jgi:hypothetical protein
LFSEPYVEAMNSMRHRRRSSLAVPVGRLAIDMVRVFVGLGVIVRLKELDAVMEEWMK